MAIPRYVAITADIPGLLASAVDFPAEGETETAALASGNNITDIIGKVLGNIAFSAGNGNIAKLDINPGGLLTALALDEGNTNTIGAIFGDPDNESALGGVSLAITSVGVFDTDFGDFDMINTLTKVKDASVDRDKVFTSSGILVSALDEGEYIEVSQDFHLIIHIGLAVCGQREDAFRIEVQQISEGIRVLILGEGDLYLIIRDREGGFCGKKLLTFAHLISLFGVDDEIAFFRYFGAQLIRRRPIAGGFGGFALFAKLDYLCGSLLFGGLLGCLRLVEGEGKHLVEFECKLVDILALRLFDHCPYNSQCERNIEVVVYSVVKLFFISLEYLCVVSLVCSIVLIEQDENSCVRSLGSVHTLESKVEFFSVMCVKAEISVIERTVSPLFELVDAVYVAQTL